jgi:hypothetical protein
LVRAAEQYEDHADGLGDEFLDEVSAALRMLSEHPEAGEVIVPRPRRSIRRWVLERFPFTLIYVPGERLRVLAVAYSRRMPGYWSARR